MTRDDAIIELAHWLQSPPGRYLLQWEQAQLDREVADLFGFHALQLGLPELDGLRANRMPHRWVAHDAFVLPAHAGLPLPPDESILTLPPEEPVALHCDFDALPFPDQSLDLVVLPHALELARDPHETLREVERVLRPEGRAVIVGFNPASLWGLRQRMAHLSRRTFGTGQGLFMPGSGDFLGYWRLRDWLRLLSFEVERGRFGCWRPPFTAQRWLDRGQWMEGAGERWWPVFGAVYLVVAVKRVRGMRLVGLARRERLQPKGAAVVVAPQRRREQVPETHQGRWNDDGR
jgi:SAM-dependent methyltransferase